MTRLFRQQNAFSTVTAVLPPVVAEGIINSILTVEGTSCLVWKARGTLLSDNWWRRVFPPISPQKTMLQVIVPDDDVDELLDRMLIESKLNQQATGAIFSTPWQHGYVGSQFHTWPSTSLTRHDDRESKLRQDLSIIHCIVSHKRSDKVAKAAIDAGAHGPVVFYSEGRGIRDRLGWLRITKEAEKEVLNVICDDGDVDEVFEAMAKAGDLHLPGAGFMYRVGVEKGMFNLPSRVSHHHYAANIHQIINAIDHLSGHTHWRDQAVVEIGSSGRGAGIGLLTKDERQGEKQWCIAAVINRNHMESMMDLMLDAGAPGLNIHHARFAGDETCGLAKAKINDEYAMMRCITTESTTKQICKEIEDQAEAHDLKDLCVLVNPVQDVATYVYKSSTRRSNRRAA